MPQKLTHREAAYREPGLPARSCALCSMFRDSPKEHCTAVEDPIKWFGLCKIFERKESDK